MMAIMNVAKMWSTTSLSYKDKKSLTKEGTIPKQKGNPRVLSIRVHSLYNENPDKYVSAVDAWRTWRPIEMLKKKGWDAESRGRWFKSDTIEDPRMLDELKALGKRWDVIYMSYLREQEHYLLMVWLRENYGTKIAMDIDDDLFNMSTWNPARNLIYEGSKDHFNLWSVVRDVDYITTTTEHLAKKYRSMRPNKPADSVVVIPNYSSIDFYKPKPPPDNGDEVIIGWAGSMHHQGDLKNSGFYMALEKIMHQHRNTRFECVGFPLMEVNLPAKRKTVKFVDKPGADYWKKLYNTLRFDIGCAPLEDSEFNKGKSNIKWQEYALMGAAFIGSDVGPYKNTVKHGTTGLLAKNEREWVQCLDELITNSKKRKELAKQAQRDVLDNWTLEENINAYEDYFRKIAAV